MMGNDAPKPGPPPSEATNQNTGGSTASINARILTIARALGRQIAREQLKRMSAANADEPSTK